MLEVVELKILILTWNSMFPGNLTYGYCRRKLETEEIKEMERDISINKVVLIIWDMHTAHQND